MSEVPRHIRAVNLAVLALATLYATYFSFYTCIYHQRFSTYAYDLGTFDQGVWLAGHGSDLFVTVRGLHLLGDHVRLFSFVLAPLYYLWDDVRALLILQSVAIAAGAWFLCRIAQRELPDRPWLVLAICAGWLLHPAVQNLNLDHAHPDAFASTLILASIDFLRGGTLPRVGPFWIAAALAMSCKEDVPLVFVAMGLVMMLDEKQRGLGAKLASVAVVYFAICVALILPHFNGIGFFRLDKGGFLAGLGSQGFDPGWIAGRLLSPQSAAYLFVLGAPHLFLFVLAPLWLVPALPSIAANLVSDASYMRNLHYHYHTSIVPFLFLATIAAFAKVRHWRTLTARVRARDETGTAAGDRLAAWTSRALGVFEVLAPAAILGASLAANVTWSKVPVHRTRVLLEMWESLGKDDARARIREALATIPSEAVVAADYSLVPHLAHRRGIYMLPNPFEASYWGISGENPADPESVDYIALRKDKGGDLVASLVADLVESGRFERVAADSDFGLYRRVAKVALSEHASCADWDGNGLVTTDDVRWISAAIMGSGDCPPRVCDADGDGRVSAADVLRIAKRVRDPATALECAP